ncbi:MAG TPA: alpha/beta family hydrolase [Hyphomicrobiaceae bacterium]|nr:alpha/beta family hydrolase [Hyphomicrobiaceae bacterium]
MTELLLTGGANADTLVVLAHGAGAPMTSPFMNEIAGLLAERAVATARFEFAYMAARRHGRRPPPPRVERLQLEYEVAVASVRRHARNRPLLIGGKSLGGRVASLLAGKLHADGVVAGLVCLGYPFHPPNKPENLRTAHLAELACPTLIVQGERDPFGNRAEVESYPLSPAIRIRWAPDGDHDLGPRGASGFTRRGNLQAAADAIAAFARSLK